MPARRTLLSLALALPGSLVAHAALADDAPTPRTLDRVSVVAERASTATKTDTLVAFSPMERAASSNWASASRTLACQTGDSTRKTRCSPSTLASRQRLRRGGGNWGRN